jgi:hypothetical protein
MGPPKVELAFQSAGGQPTAVRGEGHKKEHVATPRQDHQFVANGSNPDLDRVTTAAATGVEPSVVGREDFLTYRQRVALGSRCSGILGHCLALIPLISKSSTRSSWIRAYPGLYR